MNFGAIESTLTDTAMAVFANATATHGADTIDVVVTRETPDAFQTSRTARWIMEMPAGALALSVNDSVAVTGEFAGTYKVLDVDPSDGMITVVTLGASA